MKYAAIGLLILFMSRATPVRAQAGQPVDSLFWISAVNDTTANYFEAVASFDRFWKDKKLPPEEFEESEKEEPDVPDPDAPDVKYAFQYRRFRMWQLSVQPFVAPDGKIMTPAERIRLWQSTKSK